ncbi:TIGR03621 family F420-dependent LLM class oxidoreductase [Amycolatopsis nigrescens]|uniref:TIGR03621 family F420-dependent LLM class oxidoreductase n=1 Tax=Amycolatopsis nigrescens TaxID=381445 RepID=UPI00036A3F9C|nr:TIGR03621 family F420-dependent LLM class oxidoreductase [Amycolatopsis nigrescens]
MSKSRPFRFAVNMHVPASRKEWVEKCRKAEELGYQVIGVADHLGMPPPFPSLVLAAEATERARLNTYVLNAPFYNPTLLAREATGTDQFTDGRLELGLGAGYVQAEFEAAGIPFERPGLRIDHLERTITELQRLYADPEHKPRPVQQPGPPLMIAGGGDRLLTLAARYADIIGFAGGRPVAKGAAPSFEDDDGMLERVEFVRDRLHGRDAELNLLLPFLDLTGDRAGSLEKLRQFAPGMTEELLDRTPSVLIGDERHAADRLHELRERFGFSYFTVLEDNLEPFSRIVGLLR